MTEQWTLAELVSEVATRIAALPAPKNGQVRAVPDDRTIRYYATLGLIDRPDSMRGRTAIYGRKHLAQIVAIKRMQTMGRSLAEIQALWPTLDDPTLSRMAGVALPITVGRAPARQEFWKREPAAGIGRERAADIELEESVAGDGRESTTDDGRESTARNVRESATGGERKLAGIERDRGGRESGDGRESTTDIGRDSTTAGSGRESATLGRAAADIGRDSTTAPSGRESAALGRDVGRASTTTPRGESVDLGREGRESTPARRESTARAQQAPIELRIELAPNVSLVLAIVDEHVSISPAEVRAIRAAAAPLIAELAQRRLTTHAGGEP